MSMSEWVALEFATEDKQQLGWLTLLTFVTSLACVCIDMYVSVCRYKYM